MNITSSINRSSDCYRLRPFGSVVIIVLPVVLITVFLAAMNFPYTRPAFLWLLRENHPVELLTFVFLFIGGIFGLRLSYQLRISRERPWIHGFYAFFSLGLLFIAMEEVAWGQWFFGFETPAAFKALNAQGELTLHNIQGLQGRSEFFRLLFGLGGLTGYVISRFGCLRKIAPPVLLLPWFLVIIAHAGLDLYNDYFPLQTGFDHTISRSSELVEMLIGMTGLLYVWLNARMLQGRERDLTAYRSTFTLDR